jgi:hypothetical protein
VIAPYGKNVLVYCCNSTKYCKICGYSAVLYCVKTDDTENCPIFLNGKVKILRILMWALKYLNKLLAAFISLT